MARVPTSDNNFSASAGEGATRTRPVAEQLPTHGRTRASVGGHRRRVGLRVARDLLGTTILVDPEVHRPARGEDVGEDDRMYPLPTPEESIKELDLERDCH